MVNRRPGGAQYIPRPADWRPGGPAPWAAGTCLRAADLAAAVRARPGRDSYTPDEPDGRLSAVLALLVDGPRGAEVLLTRRAAHLRNHRGEISFPGGRVERDEDVETAALREACEEVGLDPAAVTLAGHLDPISTFVSRSFIVPVVGTALAKPELRASPGEVDRILWVPLAELTRADTFHEEWWELWGAEREMWFFDLDDETIWGATARMLHQLLTLAH